MFQRVLKLSQRRSAFLLRPRQTGKSTLLRASLLPHDMYINLLSPDILWSYSKDLSRFREEVLQHFKRRTAGTCMINEVQKIPALLDEVHNFIESDLPIRFILTGSSARKHKRGGANLLAGRANVHYLYPLLASELGAAFNLERALRLGCLPYLWDHADNDLKDPTVAEAGWENDFLKAYTHHYLREEVQA